MQIANSNTAVSSRVERETKLSTKVTDRASALSILGLANAQHALLDKVADKVLLDLAAIQARKNVYAGKTYEMNDPDWADAITAAVIPLTTYAFIRTAAIQKGPTIEGVAKSFESNKLKLIGKIDNLFTARISRDSILAVAGCEDVISIE